jgi:FkbM family methyltransferase
MMKSLQNSVHRLLGKSPMAAKLAVKLRNQANCVIACHLGETPDPKGNGEFMLVEHLGPCVSTFIDVGANIGEWSEQMLKHSNSKGFLFEPSSLCVRRLEERFRNRDVVIRGAAVSDEAGTALFAEEDHCGEGSSLAEARDNDDARRREVTVTTLDTEFADSGYQCDFLKIDTEGYDLKVMKGAVSLLSRTRFVQFEYNSHWISVGSSLAEATRFLAGLGFSIFLVRSTGLHPLRYEFWSDFYRYSNFFACRPADLDRLRALIRPAI